MLDLLRNLTKSADEKQQELLNAYLDDALTPSQRQQFEQELAQDSDLQRSLEQGRILKQQLRQLPRRPIPRSFQLDPAVYGRPQKQPLFQLYPIVRLATVMTAFFFILTVATDLFLVQGGAQPAAESVKDVAMVAEEAVEAPAQLMVEVTRVIAETESVEADTSVGEPELMLEAETVVESEVAAMDEVETREEAVGAAEEAAVSEETAEEVEMAAEEIVTEGTDTAVSEGESFAATASTNEEFEADEAATATPAATQAPPTLVDSARATATMSVPPRPSEPADGGERLVPAPQSTTTADLDEAALSDDSAAESDDSGNVGTQRVAPDPPMSGLRIAQIGLGVAVLLLAALTYLLRRQM